MGRVVIARVIAAVIALVVTWLGVPSPATASALPSAAVTFAYGGHHHPQTTTSTTTARGPPRNSATHNAVDRWSNGPLKRPAPATSRSINTYDTPFAVGQRAKATSTTRERVLGAYGPLSSSASTGVAANAGTSLVGRSYGLGTVVENPGLAIKGFQGSKTAGHALNQIINRGVSPSMLRNTVANPKVVLRQGSGNYLHLSDDAVVVMRPDGQVVTAYGRADFRQHILDILADAG